MSLLKLFLPKITFTKLTRRILTGKFAPMEVEMIISTFLMRSRKLIPEMPQGIKWGPRFLLRMACMDIILFHVLMSHNINKREALYLLETIQWEMIRCLPVFLYRLSVVFSRNTLKRLIWIDRLLWKFFFSSPFRRDNIRICNSGVAYNVVQCPLAKYFRRHRNMELCVTVFCHMAYHCADTWCVILDRGHTLASGARVCDFRFQISSEESLTTIG